MPDYEQGYKDGESSGYADWLMALDEEFDFGETEIDGPQDFIKWLRAKFGGWQPIETGKPQSTGDYLLWFKMEVKETPEGWTITLLEPWK